MIPKMQRWIWRDFSSLDAQVQSVKADEKVRMSYMLLQEAYARERRLGVYTNNVTQIRGNMKRLKIADMSEILRVSANNSESVIAAITAHPDWNDEQVAEEILWEK